MILPVVIIAGATSMIGQSCTEIFSKSNYQLVLVGRSSEKLEKLTSNLKSKNSPKVFNIDISDEKAVKTMVQETMDCFGRIDGLIYNMGIYPWKKIENLSLSDWKKTLDINLTGSFLLTKECIPHMKVQRSGKIVFVSSVAGENAGLPFMSAYSATKAGLNGFMRTAAIELAPYNINVNSISPGKIYDPSTLSKTEQKTKTKPIPLSRFQKPSDVAEMALFLISEKSKNITGQNIVIDGGQTILGEESHLVTEERI